MKALVLGAGMMGRAIAYDLCKFSNFDSIVVADSNRNSLKHLKEFLRSENVEYMTLDIEQTDDVKKIFCDVDVIISEDDEYKITGEIH